MPALGAQLISGLGRKFADGRCIFRRRVPMKSLLLATLCWGALLLATGTAASAAKRPSHGVPTPPAIDKQGYVLVKNWDFTKTVATLDQLHAQFFTRYVYNHGTLDTLNDEWERYADLNNHVFDNNGLNLVARVERGFKRGGIASGMLRSKWLGEYGYYEARVKVPKARGMWPAFWLNPNDEKWPPEIDIFEFVNNGRDTTRNSYHFIHPGDQNEKALKVDYSILDQSETYRPGFDYADGYHTFAVLWTPGSVTHYVDGVEVVSREMAWTHKDGSDGGPAHVLMNLAVGGGWPGPPLTADDFPAELQVQYIRVWQNPTISPKITEPAPY
jgi:beta-glucanase (GH16 family)